MGKIVVKKRKTEDRRSLLAELKKYQLDADQMAQLHSTSAMQTQGLKKFANDLDLKSKQVLSSHTANEDILEPQGRRRWRRRKRNNAQVTSSSSSELDTDQMSSSSDTDCYYESSSSHDIKQSTKPTVTSEIAKFAKTAPIQPVKTTNVPCESKTDEIKPIVEISKPAVFVQVLRNAEIEKARLELPIIGEEQTIMELIRYNDIVILSGETGSGKTTQVPQFLYEAGYTNNGNLIGITEPRRVAAVSMSERVAKELNLTQKEVSYQIRFSGNVTDQTKIKFMTDGVLLRECQRDFLLSKYSAIIIDEAHERSVFSDILIGLLSRIVPMRARRNNPLKLIIMSATLRVIDFTQNTFLFKTPPPTINIEARQFPITVKFANKTPDNHLRAAYRKVCSVHSKLPRGGILVFVTSQMDVKVLCKKLREKFPALNQKKSIRALEKDRKKQNKRSNCDNNRIKLEHASIIDNLKQKEDIEFCEEEVEDNQQILFTKSSKNETLGWSDNCSDSDEDEGILKSTNCPLYTLGLYAMLPLEKQRLVFCEPPNGSRLCVVATNVAETSITIPNIRYVIDTGLEKTKIYDIVTGVSRFVTTWTSKSSAEQRKGRAGRMGPGHCFRLYSSAVFSNDFPDFAQPRILQKPVEDVLLQMKSMNIDNVVNFPFPTRPSLQSLIAAEKKLIVLGALDDTDLRNARPSQKSKTEFTSKLTKLGKAMSRFAVSARCSKLIVLSPPNLLPHVINLVAALTVREMYLDNAKSHSLRKKFVGHGDYKLLGDFMAMLKAICIADKSGCSHKHCLENGLRTKAMLEIDKLRKQLTHEINNNLKYPLVDANYKSKKPTGEQCVALRKLLLSAYCDNVATKIPDGEVAKRNPDDPNVIEKTKLKNAYECKNHNEPVYISSESVLKGEHPDHLIYKELYQGDKRMYMRDVAVVDSTWLLDP